jgi:hypothetical protein
MTVDSVGEDACHDWRSPEDPTVSPTPIPNDDSTQRAAQGADTAAAEECRLMAELWIIEGGGRYFYDGYSYDRLSDAIAYAQLIRGQPRRPGQCESIDFQTASDLQLMKELSISYANGCFVFEGFRFDRLIDAANYARLRRSSAATR